MNKYKTLAGNTALFAISTFSSKFLVFLLMPLYTRVLTTAETGTTDLIVQTANLMLPLVTFGMLNAVIRFGLDKSYRKDNVFTSTLVSIFCGMGILIIFSPLLMQIEFISDYIFLICLYVFVSTVNSLCTQFCRVKKYLKLYAINGVVSTITTIFFTVLFLVFLDMGITGYVLAIIVSDGISAILVFTIAKLWRYLNFKTMDLSVTRQMLKYAMPMIPATVFWWVTNVSDRYMVTYFIDESANGLYSISYKIPTMLILCSTIFSEAWQISALGEDKKTREGFFSEIFSAYSSVIFVGVSGIILFCKVFTKILVAESYYPSWEYIPVLAIATAFSCFVTFLGSIYMVEKKSVHILLTTCTGAVLNVILNLLLIPQIGAIGAAVATFSSYFLVFLLRARDSRHYIKIKWNIPHFSVNFIIIWIQAIIMILELPNWIIFESVLFLLVLVMNIRPIIGTVKKILGK